MNQQQYDYSKFKNITQESSPKVIYQALSEDSKHFFGIHYVNDQMEIDIERYITACNIFGNGAFIPKQLGEEKEQYFTPKRKKKTDYYIYIYLNSLDSLKQFWYEEYVPTFKSIQTPKQVEESCRIESLMCTSCSDEYDNIMVDAMMEGFKRQKEYVKVIQDLYAMFICRMCIEIDRVTLSVINCSGYENLDFSFDDFVQHFKDNNKSDKKFEELDSYCAFCLLHRVANFIKHNSIKAYNKLKRQFPKNVKSKDNGTATCNYENGMNALDWIVLKPNFIEHCFKKLPAFFKDYCHCVYGEQYDRIDWDNEEYFETVIERMIDLFCMYNIQTLYPKLFEKQ